jgi:hypothetical protein
VGEKGFIAETRRRTADDAEVGRQPGLTVVHHRAVVGCILGLIMAAGRPGGA